MSKQLNDNENDFVIHLCTDAANNGALAYKMAYPLAKKGHRQNAYRLITKDYIKQAIAKKRDEIAEEVEITANLCTERFNTVYYSCISNSDYAGALRAVENHAKHVGYYDADNQQRKAQLQVAIKTEQTFIDEAIATARALDDAPDAMAR